MGRIGKWVAAFIILEVGGLSSTLYCQEVSWESISGPTGGNVDAMTTGPDGTIYAVAGMRLFETGDEPVDWKYLDSLGWCEGLAVDRSGTIYASSNTIAKSTDGGRSWQHSAGIFSHSVAIGPGGYIYAGGSDGVVYVSSDQGNTWTKTVTGMSEEPDSRIYGLAVDSEGVVYAGGSGIYKSTDKGKTWEDIDGSVLIQQITVAEERSGSGFKERIIAANGQMLYTSGDGGETWEGVEFSPTTIRSLTSDSAGDVCAIYDGGFFYSSDYGNSWQSVESASMNFIDVSCAISPDGYLYAGAMDGVYRLKLSSPDSGWKKVDAGLTAVGVAQLAFTHPANGLPVCAFALDKSYFSHVFRMENGSKDWIECDQGTGSPIHCVAVAPDNSVFVGTDHGVFVSADSGITWNEQSATLQSIGVSSIAPCPDGEILVGSEAPGGVFKSTDDGLTWHKSTDGLANQMIASTYAAANGELFAWGGNLPGGPSGGLFRSGNGGNDWQQIGLPTEKDIVVSVVETPVGYLLFTDGTKVYREAEENGSWTDVTPYGSSFPQSLAINSYGDILLGGSSHVYLSEDYGGTWQPIFNVGPANSVTCVAFDGANYAYVGTELSIYRSVDPIEKRVTSLPVATLIRQNYPNPFNTTTVILYDVAQPSHVDITLYDVLGRKVRTIVDGYREAGRYIATVHANNLSSGVYFYRLEAGTYREVKKMLLLK